MTPSCTEKIFWRSVDDGSTWTLAFVSCTSVAGGQTKIVLRSPDGADLLAFATGSNYNPYVTPNATAFGVALRSSDQGASWINTRRYANDVYSAVIQPRGTGYFIAGMEKLSSTSRTASGIFRSVDTVNWAAIPAAGLPLQFVRALASSTDNPASTLYAALSADTQPTIYKSMDLGVTWAGAADGLPAVRVNALAVDPSSPSTVYAGTDGAGLFRSRNGGASWERTAAGVYELHVRSLQFDSVAPEHLYATTDGDVLALDTTTLPDTPPLAVEYFYPAFGHYFLSAFPEEVAALDRGALPGWVRTGESFQVDTANANGVNPVCRFFTTAFAPKSSHFYTPYTEECAVVNKNPAWQYEAIAFGLRLRGLDGTCPAGYRPLYRLYNNGMSGAPNHRYTVKLAIAQQMQAQGWIVEGDAVTGAFACVPN